MCGWTPYMCLPAEKTEYGNLWLGCRECYVQASKSAGLGLLLHDFNEETK